MRFEKAALPGVVVVHPEPNADDRGYFARLFCEQEFAAQGLESRFPQASLSFNRKAGTVRGMHFQRAPHAETKLVRCSRGAVYDVLVDVRPESPTYCQWQGFELSADTQVALYVPPGFAHGFQTLVDDSEVTYCITPTFTPGFGAGVRWDDPAIGVRWPMPITVIHERDGQWPLVTR